MSILQREHLKNVAEAVKNKAPEYENILSTNIVLEEPRKEA